MNKPTEKSQKEAANLEYIRKNQEVNAGSLGRVYQHVQKHKVPSWGILTSYRDDTSDAKNKELFKQLKGEIRDIGLGFFEMKGYGQEEDEETGRLKVVMEPSLFIPGIKFKDIKRLSRQYKQFGFVYSGPEIKNKIMFISKVRNEQLDSFHPMKIAQFFSNIKGKPFVFFSVDAHLWDKPAQSNVERLWRHLQGFNNFTLVDA